MNTNEIKSAKDCDIRSKSASRFTIESILGKLSDKKKVTFNLIIGDDLETNQNFERFRDCLAPFLINERRVMSWPGTDLLEGLAIQNSYVLRKETNLILRRLKSPFDYIAPDYPEDLSFYVDGELVYACCAHEKIELIERIDLFKQ